MKALGRDDIRWVTPGERLMETLDRVLDKGIVLDAWTRVAQVGVSLIEASPIGRVEVNEKPSSEPPYAVYLTLSVGKPSTDLAERRRLERMLAVLGDKATQKERAAYLDGFADGLRFASLPPDGRTPQSRTTGVARPRHWRRS